MPNLFDLPVEILEKILILLPLSSLLAISSSSKLLQSLFQDSVAVQYSFLLQVTHMKDGSGASRGPDASVLVPIAERLALLKQRDQRWRSLKAVRTQEITAADGDRGTLYDYLGGVLALGLEAPCKTLRFYKIPSTAGPPDVLSRTFTPGWTIKDFTMDPAQDLLVLVQVYSPSMNGNPLIPRRFSYRLHLFNLTSFAPHPEAKEHVLTWPYYLNEGRASPFVSIMDSNVMLHGHVHTRERGQGGAVVWNWKTGVTVSALPSNNLDIIESVSFIGPGLFLTAVYDVRAEMMLMELYTFDSCLQPPENEPNPEAPVPIRLAAYHLPELQERPELVTIRLDPAPGEGNCVPPFSEGLDRAPMFQADGAERIVILDMVFLIGDPENDWMATEERYTLFTLKSTLLRALRHHPPLHKIHEVSTDDIPAKTAVVKTMLTGLEEEEDDEGWEDEDGWEDEEREAVTYAWEDWSAKTRILHHIPQPAAWVLFVYQLKFVHSVFHVGLSENGEQSVRISARILDFSPYSAARLKHFGASQHTSSGTVFPDHVELPPVEEAPDGDVGRLITKPTVCEPGSVWIDQISTGQELPYVERRLPVSIRETIGGGGRLSGLCIDEQRLLWVRRDTNGNLILDVHFF